MAAEATGGRRDGIAAFLAEVTACASRSAGFVVQVALTSRIHRSLGLAFALLLLPVTLGSSAIVVLVTGALWAPQLARVLDSTLRYTVDKTTREVLFLPLPADLKHRAKPFIDVTMDRFAKALAAILLLVLIKPWGLGLDWRRLSYASLAMTGLWVGIALVARREYLPRVPRQHRRARRSRPTRSAPTSPTRRRSRRSSRSCRIPTNRPCSTRSRCSRRSTSAT